MKRTISTTSAVYYIMTDAALSMAHNVSHRWTSHHRSMLSCSLVQAVLRIRIRTFSDGNINRPTNATRIEAQNTQYYAAPLLICMYVCVSDTVCIGYMYECLHACART